MRNCWYAGVDYEDLPGIFDNLVGDVLIDPEGIVRVHHVGTGPADRPSVSSLPEIVRGSHA
jgi:hypothetical protein